MSITALFMFLLIGAIAGWIAGLIMKGKGSGIILNMIIGIIGAFIGGWAFSFLGLYSNSFLGSLTTAVFGSVILLFIVKKLK
ncbi:MAG: GlsB/YeaQ/YmgE family stress response membrane protein [Gammaproteobacteria bacterium]|nr:GlsB/YeaQ/YmgE family stress response membrane protein [Gammaproteobacteria bacterium]